jgi:thiamine-phosphate pyrophosphorylase
LSGAATSSDPWGLCDRRLYLCTPDRPDLEHFVEACIEGGVDLVQLREKHLSDDRLATRAALVQRVCGQHGVPFILNDNPELGAAIGADGVHIGQDDVPPTTARLLMGARAIIGLSTHTPADLDAAIGKLPPGIEPIGAEAGWRAAPVDYISAGPVVATPTKPGRPGTGLGYVSEAVKRAPMSVWVTGGADPITVVDMIGAGASHIVAVRWLTEAADPRANARALRRAIDETLARDGCRARRG